MQRKAAATWRACTRVTISAALLVPTVALAQLEPAASERKSGSAEAAASVDESNRVNPSDKATESTTVSPPDESEASSSPKATAVADSGAELGKGRDKGQVPDQEKPETASDTGGITVLRLPDSAYPQIRVRGLRGGSLWLTFHGMQWPYLPKQPGEADFLLGLSGSAWVDTAYERIHAGSPNESHIKYWLQQGRAVVRATPTYRVGRDWFVQGQVELVGNNDQSAGQPYTADTDDLWVRAGKWNVFDVQLGRFEAWELYHLGMGLDLNTFERRGAQSQQSTPPDFYGTTYAYYRPSGAGNIAGHIYFTDWLRLELLQRIGNDSGTNVLGQRTALVVDLGWLKLKGGGEYLKGSNRYDNQQDRYEARGGGGAIQFVFDPYVEFGANFGRGLRDAWNMQGGLDEQGSTTVQSYGGFLNARIVEGLLVGGGVNMTQVEDVHRDSYGRVGQWSQDQFYGALQYALFGRLYLKAVVAQAKAHFAPSYTDVPAYDNTMLSMRFRASYYF